MVGAGGQLGLVRRDADGRVGLGLGSSGSWGFGSGGPGSPTLVWEPYVVARMRATEFCDSHAASRS